MNKQLIIITGAGLVIGFAEALIYYNMGKSSEGEFSVSVPKGKELVKTMGAVVVTSLLTAALTGAIESGLQKKIVTA